MESWSGQLNMSSAFDDWTDEKLTLLRERDTFRAVTDPTTGQTTYERLPLKFMVPNDGLYCFADKTGQYWRLILDGDGEYWKERVL